MIAWDEEDGAEAAPLKTLVKRAQPTDRLGISKQLADSPSGVRCPSCGSLLTWREVTEYRCGPYRNFTHT